MIVDVHQKIKELEGWLVDHPTHPDRAEVQKDLQELHKQIKTPTHDSI